jgi:signal transduction histidine kinase
MFRIFQESLINVARYSEAKKVDVSIRHSDQQLVLLIEDNGNGFDSSAGQHNITLGIRVMKERALQLKGTYHVNSFPGKGTIVEVCVPFDHSN